MRGLFPLVGWKLRAMHGKPRRRSSSPRRESNLKFQFLHTDNDLLGLAHRRGKPCDSICPWNADFHATEHCTEH